MASISFTDSRQTKTPARVELRDLPAGGHLIRVEWTKVGITLDLDEATRLRDDLTAALDQAGEQ